MSYKLIEDQYQYKLKLQADIQKEYSKIWVWKYKEGLLCLS